MKALILALALTTISTSSFAQMYSSETFASGAGGSYSSETFGSNYRQQLNANKAAVAAFIQTGDLETNSPEVKEIVQTKRLLLIKQINEMSDRDVLLAE